jgi:hypothetical protein
VHGKKLEARPCKVFGKPLVYFFALRPAFRLRGGDEKSHQINRFPFVFVLSPSALTTPYHVYPFDTGAAAMGLFDERADPTIPLEDYELQANHAGVAAHIGWAFGTLENYLDGDLQKDVLKGIPAFEAVTTGYVDIARMASTGSNLPDKRASAIEVASSHNIDLKNNVEFAIIPKQYLEDVSANDDFISRLSALGIEYETYDWQPNSVPDHFELEITRIAKARYKKMALLP